MVYFVFLMLSGRRTVHPDRCILSRTDLSQSFPPPTWRQLFPCWADSGKCQKESCFLQITLADGVRTVWEGREEVKRDVVKAMIEEGYPEASILRIACVTPEEYKKWAAEKPD